MDVAKAFTFVAEDEGWLRKIGIGALVSIAAFLIVPIPLLFGWMVGITRNVKDGVDYPMPEWDDLGQLFRDGLAVMVAQIVYTSPVWILVCVAVIATVGLGGVAGSNQDLFAAGMLATWAIIGCLILILSLAFFFLSPAIVIQYVRTNELSATFRFGEVFSIARDNVADILIAALATFAASIGISTVLSIIGFIPCLGWVAAPILGLLIGPYLLALSGHLYGQIAGKMDGKVGAFESL